MYILVNMKTAIRIAIVADYDPKNKYHVATEESVTHAAEASRNRVRISVAGYRYAGQHCLRSQAGRMRCDLVRNEQPLSQHGRRFARDPLCPRKRRALRWNLRRIPTCSGRVCTQCLRAQRCGSRRILAKCATETDHQTYLLAGWTETNCKNCSRHSGTPDLREERGDGSLCVQLRPE